MRTRWWALELLGGVLLALSPLRAQSIQVTLTNWPATADRAVLLADRGPLDANPKTRLVVDRAVTEQTVTRTMNVPVAGGYRVRAVAYKRNGTVYPPLLRDGMVADLDVRAGAVTAASLAFSSAPIGVADATPAGPPPGGIANVELDFVDPGQFLSSGQSGLLWVSPTPLTRNGSAPEYQLATLTDSGPELQHAAFAVSLPASGNRVYYQFGYFGWEFGTASETPVFVWPDVNAGVPSRRLDFSSGATISLSVSNLPAEADRLVVLADPGGEAAKARAEWPVTPSGSGPTVVTMQVPAGTYRLRAIAYASGLNYPRVLRTGAASVTAGASGTVAAALTMAVPTVSPVGGTPLQVPESVASTLSMRFQDAGEFLAAGRTVLLYGTTGELTTNMQGAPLVSTLQAAGTGVTTAAFPLLLPPSTTMSYQIGVFGTEFSNGREVPVLFYPELPLATPLQAVSLRCNAVLQPAALTFAATGGSQDVQVTVPSAVCPWSVLGLPAWLTASPASGTGSATVRLTAAPQ